MSAQWGKQFWADLGERVGSTAVQAALSLPVLQAVPSVPMSWALVWAVIGIPTATSFLKGILVNLSTGPEPSASLVKVTSNGEPNPVMDEDDDVDGF